MADSHGLGGGFFFADDQHVGNLVELSVADLRADFFGRVVVGGTQTGGFELVESLSSK